MCTRTPNPQLYDLGDPWGASGTGDGNALNRQGNATQCCKTFENCHPAASCTAAQNAPRALNAQENTGLKLFAQHVGIAALAAAAV